MMTVGRCHAVSKSRDCKVLAWTTAALTLEKGRGPDIVMESKIGNQGIQVVVVELVSGPINDCAGKQVSVEGKGKEKLMRRVGGMETKYMGWGLIKNIFNFSDGYDCCSVITVLIMKPEIMFRLHVWHSSSSSGSGSNRHNDTLSH